MSLSERAMLATVTIRTWSARRIDKTATREVARNHGSDESMGRYNKHLIDPDGLRPVTQAATAIREYHYSRTLPWSQEGPRILSADLYLEYMERMRGLREVFDREVSAFLTRYPDLVENARSRLNGLFRSEEYPSVARLAEKFGVEISIDPLPAASDFRVSLGTEEENRIRDEIERRGKTTVQTAMRDAWTRLHDALRRTVETCNTDSPRFRDSMLESLQDLVSVLPRMNVGADSRLSDMCADLSARVAGLSSEILRTDESARSTLVSVAADAEDRARSILDDMAAMYGHGGES